MHFQLKMSDFEVLCDPQNGTEHLVWDGFLHVKHRFTNGKTEWQFSDMDPVDFLFSVASNR